MTVQRDMATVGARWCAVMSGHDTGRDAVQHGGNLWRVTAGVVPARAVVSVEKVFHFEGGEY